MQKQKAFFVRQIEARGIRDDSDAGFALHMIRDRLSATAPRSKRDALRREEIEVLATALRSAVRKL